MTDASPAIDEDLQSRQMAVYGRESMQKLKCANVLISGLNGLGAEIAKNVILANVNSVTLHDDKAATLADLGSHFYLTESDVGTNRAAACVQQMQELNPAVRVASLAGPLPIERLHEWSVVVGVDLPLDVALRADEHCRAASPPSAFIRADVRGLCGAVFVDLGPAFSCLDPTGESIKSAIVEHLSLGEGGKKLLVQCVEDEPMDLDDGDHITLSEVQGMEALNGMPPLPVGDVSKGKRRFSVELPPALTAQLTSAYRMGGIVTEQRQPKPLSFRSLADFLSDAGQLAEVDESKMAPAATSFSEEFLMVMGSPAANLRYGRSGLLHLGFRCLDEFRARHGGELPPAADDAAVEEMQAIAVQINGTCDAEHAAAQLDEPSRKAVIDALSRGADAVLSPMAAIFGGIVGQEVVKAATGKFHPIHQGFYMDALECLPDTPPPRLGAAALESAGRYAAQALVFGSDFVEQLRKLKVFLVGSGALGCELLKGFALMGVSCGGDGDLAVTDDDVIEKSNLSRQFLFRNHNVGQSKSESAVQAVGRMNPHLKARALQDRVSPQTEGVFNTDFWVSRDLVVNALDNVKARLYVDERCVLFQKPLLESGTLGTKCNTQMVLPHLTENYGASRDPPEKEAPQCAVHNFPHNIDQCLVLAHSEFVGNFDTTPREVAEFLEKGREWVSGLTAANESTSSILDKLRGDPRVCCGMSGGCRDVMVAERSSSWAECVGWARRKFESYFCNRIAQLLHNFPADAKTSQGVPFWSPPKRLPRPLPFDAADPLHMQFIMSAANLRAHMMGVPPPPDCRDLAALAALLSACAVPPFAPALDASIETDNKEEDERRKAAAAPLADDATQIEAAVTELLAAKAAHPDFAPRPNEFEKDDDSNFHMDFISSFGNLRARNYAIDEVDKFAAKLKAGRIIPAIATTTAMATGFVCLELYKQLIGLPLEKRRNVFANLALPGPLIMLSEPMPCPKIASGQRWDPDMYMDVDEVAYPEGHSLWDRILVEGAAEMTLGGLKQLFATEHKLVLTELYLPVGSKNEAVFSATLPGMAERSESNLARLLPELVSTVTGSAPRPGSYYPLSGIIFQTEAGDDAKVAKVVLKL